MALSALVHTRRALGGALLALTLAVPALAAEPEPKLGEELTPFGAIRAANKNGTIPAWTGGMDEPPPEYVPGRHMRDPFFEDTRWFTVHTSELERYKSRLSAGLVALLKTYPDSFEIPMFPTRRTSAAPQRIYDASIANAKRARLSENGLAVSGARGGIPFPMPKTGEQAMWNHILRWRGETGVRTAAIAIPDEGGHSTPVLYREEWLSAYAAEQEGGPALFHRRTGVRPAEVTGATLLIQQSLNPLQRPPVLWYKPAGEKAVPVRAPDFAYDTPDPATGGLRTADMTDMFSGLLDRFDFHLVGRREMYVPYNAFRLNTPDLAVEEVFWSAHPNPTLLRYELHRVWIVEATLKRGLHHTFPRRVYYLDEDSWQILMAEHYDAQGELARYAEAHGIPHPQVPVFLASKELTYDLTSGRYVVSGLDAAEQPPAFDKPLKPEDFAPETLMPKRR
ncbi:MAG TPA: DUF1329 domain-containing protein [Azospirillum sp.]|nr:DUF1329 domain-containing protein [Azospirillum sp.]